VDEIVAELVTFASVIATPAATASAPPVAAEPFAVEAADPVSEEVTVSAPPAESRPATVEDADALAIVTATAAATETGPLEVVALGGAPPVAPLPPELVAAVLALARSPATWLSTLVGAPGCPLAGAPFADAVAEPADVDVPVALIVAAPPTVSDRFVEAVTVWVALETSTEAPTAAVAAFDDPDAEVVTVAVCVDETTSAPPTEVAPPVPIEASVMTVESETATDGANVTPPPDAPAFEVVVIASVLVA